MVLRCLSEMILTDADMLPADPSLLRAIWPAGTVPPDTRALGQSLRRLVAAGRLRQLVVRREPHVALPASYSEGPPFFTRAEPGKGVGPSERPEPTAELDKEVADEFDLELALDIEHEKLLLFRVIVIVEAIIAALLVREAILCVLGL